MVTRLGERPNLQRLLANTGWLVGDRLVRIGVGVIVSALVARYLGPTQYGMYSYAGALVALFSAVATLGLDSIVIRDLVRHPDVKGETLGTAFTLRLIGAIVMIASAIAAISILSPQDDTTHWLVAIIAAASLFQSSDVVDFWFQSRVKSKYTVLARNAAFLLLAATKIGLIELRAPLVAFALAVLAEAAVAAFGLILAYAVDRQSLRAWRFNMPRARELLWDSWPLMLSSAAILVYMKINQVLLGHLAGNEAVGIYAAATRIAEVWFFLPSVIVSTVFPSILGAKRADQGLYQQRVQQLFNVMVWLGYLVAISITTFSNMIVSVLYGSRFSEAAPVVSVLAWTAPFVCLGVATQSWIVAEGMMRFSLATTVFGAAASVVLNLLLIPISGPIGAAIATLCSQIISVTLSTLFYTRTRKIFHMQLSSLLLYRSLRP